MIIIIIPEDRNVVQKEVEKKLKYKSLCTEIQRMWNLKCTIIPILIGATGRVTRSLRKNMEAVPGKHPIDSLQKTAILGTSCGKYCSLKLEAWATGITAGSREVPGRKGLWQETSISYNNNNNNNKVKITAHLFFLNLYFRTLWANTIKKSEENNSELQ